MVAWWLGSLSVVWVDKSPALAIFIIFLGETLALNSHIAFPNINMIIKRETWKNAGN